MMNFELCRKIRLAQPSIVYAQRGAHLFVMLQSYSTMCLQRDGNV